MLHCYTTMRQPAVTGHLVEDERVEIRHVALVGERPLVVFFEVSLEGHRVKWDLHHSAEIVRQHLLEPRCEGETVRRD